MHIQVVNFQLKDMQEGEFLALCDELAPVFAAVPGLVSKVWLADRTSGTYGGVYTWTDAASYAAFTRSELFAAVAGNPHFANVTSRDFGILDEPTKVTRGLATVAA